MLVITRRSSEALIIGENEINITILSINGNQVRLGIEAPPFVSVHRKEIYQRIQSEEKTCPGLMLEYSPQKKRFISGFLTSAKPTKTALHTA